MSTHWAVEHISKPWVCNTAGPDTFDCWGLVRWVYKNVLGVDLPEMPHIRPHEWLKIARAIKHQNLFEEASTPKEYDVVAMGKCKDCHHVGVYTEADGGGIVHCEEGTGVVFMSMSSVRANGYTQLKFLRWSEQHT